MAGSHHTGRRPTRVSTMARRGVQALLDGRRNAEADARLAIYVRPKGNGYHVVRNVCNAQEYTVSDMTGGSTFAPGSVVTLMSNTGNPGEGIIGRAPAGFGGASAFSISPSYRGLETIPPVEDPTGNDALTLYGFCWDDSNQEAIVARVREAVDDDGVAQPPVLELARVPRASIPCLDKGTGRTFYSQELSDTELSELRLYAMEMGPGGAVFLFLYLGEAGGSPGTALLHVYKISRAGVRLVDLTNDIPDSSTTGSIGTVYMGSSLYAVEPVEGVTTGSGGTPIENDQRITRRNHATLAVVDEWPVPNPGTYDGWTLTGSAVRAIVNASGTLRAYIEYQRTGTGAIKIFYQDFTASLSTAGAAVAFASNPNPTWGELNFLRAHPSGGVAFTLAETLYSATFAGGSLATVLASYDDDGQSFHGLAQISATESLVLGTGTLFTLSILTASGQELP